MNFVFDPCQILDLLLEHIHVHLIIWEDEGQCEMLQLGNLRVNVANLGRVAAFWL